jgi:hypothetical protein
MKSMQKRYDSLEELVTDYEEKSEIVNQLKELDESELSASQQQTIKETEELGNYLQEACQALDFVKFSTTVNLGEGDNDNKDKIECRSLLDSKEQYVKLYATLTNGGDENMMNAIEQNRQPIENFESVKEKNDILNVSTVSELEKNTSMAFKLDDVKDEVSEFFENKREISIADFENAILETFDVMEKNDIEKNGEVAFATANLTYEKNLADETNVLTYENTYDLSNYEKDHAEIMNKIENDKEVEQPEIVQPEVTVPERAEAEIELPEKAVKEEVETPNRTAEISQIELPDDTVVVAVDNTVVMQNAPEQEVEVDNYVGRNVEDIISEKFDLSREDIVREDITIETPNDKTEIVLTPIENEDKTTDLALAVEGAIVLAENKELIGQELEEVVKEQVREEQERASKAEYVVFDDTVILGEVTEDNRAIVEDIKEDVKDIKEQKDEEIEDVQEQKQDEIEDIQEQVEEEIEQAEEELEQDDLEM